LTAFLLALALSTGQLPVVHSISSPTKGDSLAVDVPYLPQTEALCGGAAAAMVFRYWGERHADAQQFAPLVDRRAGGISTGALAAAIEERHWRATAVSGSIEAIRRALSDGQPPILLVESRPSRYHYIVVVGINDKGIVAHDPAWGPSRSFALDELLRRWRATNFWTLLILPGTKPQDAQTGRGRDSAYGAAHVQPALCDRLLNEALDDIEQRGASVADEALASVHDQCPRSSRPLSELAGVRFSEHRWSDAESLARQAVAIDGSDGYAWDVLASSRFMQDQLSDALQAWNQIGKPQLDRVSISGLTRTRYALVAEALGLTPNALVTSDAFTRARRRLELLPTRESARIAYRPQEDGFALVDVAILERRAAPHGLLEWVGAGVQGLVDREIRAFVPGPTGQGEVWTASWRWWNNRPRVALSFAAPRVGRLPGIWRADGSWEAETYMTGGSSLVRVAHLHGGVSVSDWLTAAVRYEAGVGVDSWNGTVRAASLGGTLERRWLSDRLTTAGTFTNWTPITSGDSFRTAAFRATLQSSTEPLGFVQIAAADVEAASAAAPQSLWPGAGDGHGRDPLLRAHPLLNDGIVSGPVYGRRLSALTLESQAWLPQPSIVRTAVAVFTDFGRASLRPASTSGDRFQLDAGLGLRVRLPGARGTLRIDYARGLRDGRNAVTLGSQISIR
jgi:hypothetical protein